VDLDPAAEVIPRMISSGIELQAYSCGMGQKHGPAGALALVVTDAELLTTTVDTSTTGRSCSGIWGSTLRPRAAPGELDVMPVSASPRRTT
jgi:hypothetical protein